MLLCLGLGWPALELQRVSLAQTAAPIMPVVSESSDNALSEYARQRTVLIKIDRLLKSGTIIGKDKENGYLVLTHSDFLQQKTNIVVQTHDLQSHQAQVIQDGIPTDSKLVLLRFSSPKSYKIAKLGESTQHDPSHLFVTGGYRAKSGDFDSRSAPIQALQQNPSESEPSLSGGPIFHQDGDLIGVQMFGSKDSVKSSPSETQEQWQWGIPYSSIVQSMPGEIINDYFVKTPFVPLNIPQYQWTGWTNQIKQQAKALTVRIHSRSQTNSGMINGKFSTNKPNIRRL